MESVSIFEQKDGSARVHMTVRSNYVSLSTSSNGRADHSLFTFTVEDVQAFRDAVTNASVFRPTASN